MENIVLWNVRIKIKKKTVKVYPSAKLDNNKCES